MTADLAPRRPVAAAAVALLLGALVYLAGETIAAHAWQAPGYSYSGNYISDLGNPQCGPYDGRVVCSPRHALMNWAFVGQGALLGFATLRIARVLRGRPSAVLRGVGVLTVAGFVLTGAVHSSPEATANGTLWLHYLGATLAILGSNATAVLISRQGPRLGLPTVAGAGGVALGAAGIVAALIWPATLGTLPVGLLERVAVYAFTLWQICFGIALLLARAGRPGPTTDRAHSPRRTALRKGR